MKPLPRQYFRMVCFPFSMQFSLLSPWMKSYGVTIQMTPLQQYLSIPPAFKPAKCELELVLNIDIINQDSNTTDLILVDFFFVNLSSTFSTLQDNL